MTAADRGREVRQQLMRAAVELIGELGWSAVSTRLLATRAGVAPGLVHYHFRSLQALLTEAAVGAMREMVSEIEPTLETAETVEDGIARLLGSLDAYSGSDPASLLFVETYLAATRDEALAFELAQVLDEVRGRIADWLAEHDRPDPGPTAAVLSAAIDGVLLHRALDPGLTSTVVTPVLRRLLQG